MTVGLRRTCELEGSVNAIDVRGTQGSGRKHPTGRKANRRADGARNRVLHVGIRHVLNESSCSPEGGLSAQLRAVASHPVRVLSGLLLMGPGGEAARADRYKLAVVVAFSAWRQRSRLHSRRDVGFYGVFLCAVLLASSITLLRLRPTRSGRHRSAATAPVGSISCRPSIPSAPRSRRCLGDS